MDPFSKAFSPNSYFIELTKFGVLIATSICGFLSLRAEIQQWANISNSFIDKVIASPSQKLYDDAMTNSQLIINYLPKISIQILSKSLIPLLYISVILSKIHLFNQPSEPFRSKTLFESQCFCITNAKLALLAHKSLFSDFSFAPALFNLDRQINAVFFDLSGRPFLFSQSDNDKPLFHENISKIVKKLHKFGIFPFKFYLNFFSFFLFAFVFLNYFLSLLGILVLTKTSH